jgi:hypothetical protein
LSAYITNRFATKEPTACAVCHRHAVWLGYCRHQHPPVIWLCDNNDCHAAAKKVYAMPQPTLDAYEIGAVLEAGAVAGDYLEEIGRTDLATLTPDQWREFLRRIVVGFEQTMRRKILNNEAPF